MEEYLSPESQFLNIAGPRFDLVTVSNSHSVTAKKSNIKFEFVIDKPIDPRPQVQFTPGNKARVEKYLSPEFQFFNIVDPRIDLVIIRNLHSVTAENQA